MKRLLIPIIALLPAIALAQSYDLSWHTIDGGGAASTGGNLSLSGTIGQPDAQPSAMTGGAFTLTGGFWPGVADVCTLPGDMNQDGVLDGADVQLFVNCMAAGSGSCGCADIDGGGLGASDVAAFVSQLLGA